MYAMFTALGNEWSTVRYVHQYAQRMFRTLWSTNFWRRFERRIFSISKYN